MRRMGERRLRRLLRETVRWGTPLEAHLATWQRVALAQVDIVRPENIMAALALAAKGQYSKALAQLNRKHSRARARKATGLPDQLVIMLLGLNRARLLLRDQEALPRRALVERGFLTPRTRLGPLAPRPAARRREGTSRKPAAAATPAAFQAPAGLGLAPNG